METAREKISTPCLLTSEVNYTCPEKFNNYFPFGLTFNTSELEGALTNKYLYNGKELQDAPMSIGVDLNWYDYWARMYDAAVARWWVNDPMADMAPSYTGTYKLSYIYIDSLNFSL